MRAGSPRADISAEFDIADAPALRKWLQDQELEGDEDTCLLRRVMDSGGRSRGFINGRSVTMQQLREAGDFLVDIHGQHEHQSLLRAGAQRDLLDGYAGLLSEAQAVEGKYLAWQTLHRRRVEMEQNAEAIAAERELLQFQRRELETLNFNAAEWGEQQAEHARLAHAASQIGRASCRERV